MDIEGIFIKVRLVKTVLLFVLIGMYNIEAFASEDSVRILSYDKFMSIVKEHHPLARQAALLQARGDATELEARGAFDPKIFTQIEFLINQKELEGEPP